MTQQPADQGDIVQALVSAIQERTKIRLAYERKADGVLSIHEVAPMDVRGGWTPATSSQLYVWAWCYAEDRLEMHLLERVRRVVPLDDQFEPSDILDRWPIEKWPIPSDWNVPRDW